MENFFIQKNFIHISWIFSTMGKGVSITRMGTGRNYHTLLLSVNLINFRKILNATSGLANLNRYKTGKTCSNIGKRGSIL